MHWFSQGARQRAQRSPTQRRWSGDVSCGVAPEQFEETGCFILLYHLHLFLICLFRHVRKWRPWQIWKKKKQNPNPTFKGIVFKTLICRAGEPHLMSHAFNMNQAIKKIFFLLKTCFIYTKWNSCNRGVCKKVRAIPKLWPSSEGSYWDFRWGCCTFLCTTFFKV